MALHPKLAHAFQCTQELAAALNDCVGRRVDADVSAELTALHVAVNRMMMSEAWVNLWILPDWIEWEQHWLEEVRLAA